MKLSSSLVFPLEQIRRVKAMRRTVSIVARHCRGAKFSIKERDFCCQGCLIVFELLAENGLSDFYNLGGAAGVRIGKPAQKGEFDYLDESSVRERLVDFSDGSLPSGFTSPPG